MSLSLFTLKLGGVLTLTLIALGQRQELIGFFRQSFSKSDHLMDCEAIFRVRELAGYTDAETCWGSVCLSLLSVCHWCFWRRWVFFFFFSRCNQNVRSCMLKPGMQVLISQSWDHHITWQQNKLSVRVWNIQDVASTDNNSDIWYPHRTFLSHFSVLVWFQVLSALAARRAVICPFFRPKRTIYSTKHVALVNIFL